MMCGTPVLCSNFDHWRPYVEGERTGMMADPNNIDEVVKVCEQMLGDPDELVAMGKRGIEAVRTKYNWDTEFRVLRQCYEDLLKEKI
jgi:glycosyltransferase involved in cell wall biosynthesis